MSKRGEDAVRRQDIQKRQGKQLLCYTLLANLCAKNESVVEDRGGCGEGEVRQKIERGVKMFVLLASRASLSDGNGKNKPQLQLTRVQGTPTSSGKTHDDDAKEASGIAAL